MKTYFYAVIGVVLGILTVIVWIAGDRHGAARVQEKLDAFVSSVNDAGLRAEAAKAAQEAAWQRKFREQEERHAKTQADNTARFARELNRVRARPADPAGGGVPAGTATIGVCADAAGNQRLSDALSGYRAGVLRLLEACQSATDTLIACQDGLRTLTINPTEK